MKKVAKKTFKVVKKIAPFALAAAAAYFAFGGSLTLGGLTLEGGWGEAVSGLMGEIGISPASTLGSMLTTAVEHSGFGALGGAALGAATGTDIGQGAMMGALGGAATGAFSGYMAAPTGPGMSMGETGAARHGSVLSRVTGGSGGVRLPDGGTYFPPGGGGMPGMDGYSSGAWSARPSDSLFGAGGWIERNQSLIGPVLTGVGQGILANAAAEDEQRWRERNAPQAHTVPVW